MTDRQAEVMPAPGDVEQLAEDLAQDLAIVSGLLSEIATCWQRVQVTIPDLPADRPLRLQDEVRQLAADGSIQALDPHRARLAVQAASPEAKGGT